MKSISLIALITIWSASAFAQTTSFSETFDNGQVPDYFVESDGYAFYNTGEYLLIGVEKGINESQQSFSVLFPDPLDLTDSAYMSMDLRVDQSVLARIYLYDEAGKSISFPQRLIESEDFTKLSWKLDEGSSIDMSSVTRMDMNFGIEAFSYEGMAGMDNLQLGGIVQPAASILPQDYPVFFSGTKGTSLLVTDVMNADSLVFEGESVLIENILPGEVEDGMAYLQFDCMDGIHGWERITLLAKGSEGFADGRITLSLTVEGNQPPTMDEPEDLDVGLGADSLIVVPLSGIGDRNISLDQPLEIEARSSDTSVVLVKEVIYESPLGSGEVWLSPNGGGQADIYLTLSEHQPDAFFNDTFEIRIYEDFNHPPAIDNPGTLKILSGQSQDTLYLTGLSDGDDGSQFLSFELSVSDDELVSPITVEAIPGDSLLLVVEALGTGSVSMELAISDDGATAGNNGNQTTRIVFDVNVLDAPMTGYLADFSDVEADIQSGIWTYPGTYALSTVDSSSNGFYAMRVDVTDKFYWDGMNLNFQPQGVELDLSQHPFLSMEIYPLDDKTLHWLWFYDNTGTRNDLNNRAAEKLIWAEAGKWNEVFFDFSGELDWQNSDLGADIDNSRIVKVLFDMHNANFSWPPPANYTGAFLIRNLRVGSEAKEAVETETKPSMDPFTAGPYFENREGIELHLTGISDGKGSAESLNLEVSSSSESAVKVDSVSEISFTGEAVVYLSSGRTGFANLTVRVEKNDPGGNGIEMTEMVFVIKEEFTEADMLVVDASENRQTMRGFGCFYAPKYRELFTDEMHASAVRIGLIDNQIEWKNDNNDPQVLHMDSLDWNAFDWEYFRELKENGVEQFILTSWSPPPWMKDNLIMSMPAKGHEDNTTQTRNRLSLHYYDEFAESMVAVVRMFKDRCGIELDGIGLQNEPAFHEPYPSAILDPIHFRELIKVVGKRFEEEGIQTELFMPEQVFSQGYPAMEDYIDIIQQDEEANRLCSVIATHSYASDGINEGAPDWSQWTKMWNNAQEGDYPKELWMSETNVHYETFDDVLEVAAGIQGALTAGNVSLWTQWNFAEQYLEDGLPNPMLYMMSNFARFIRPGAVRLATSSSNGSLLISAFRHYGSSEVTLVAVNLSMATVSVDLSASNLPKIYETYRTSESENCSYVGTTDVSSLVAIPPQSITTFHASNHGLTLSMDDPPNMELEMNAGQQSIQVSGIASVLGSTEGLELVAEVDNEVLIPKLEVGSIKYDGSCELKFTPGSDQAGTAKITLTLSDGNQEIKEVFYVVVVDHTVGVKDAKDAEFFSVYPNPAGETLKVRSSSPMQRIEILGLGGKLCGVIPADGLDLKTVNVSELNPGLYLLRVTDSEGNMGHRSFVKQ